MAAKKTETHEMNRLLAWGRKLGLAYLGAFGVAGDTAGEWFEMFVERGEQVEKDLRKRTAGNRKAAEKFAADLQHERQAAAVRANKSIKKAVKQAQPVAG